MNETEAPEEFSSPQLSDVWRKARRIALEVAGPNAHQVDEEQMWPEHTMSALATAGLLGLHVPQRLGGLGMGLTGLIAITEQLGQACSSSSMCFGMHSVGTAVIAAKATPHHEERYLRPIAKGEHITTLALSESGSGVHFYLPQTAVSADADGYSIRGTKQWVTNAGHADSYVVSCCNEDDDQQSGEFTCVVVDSDAQSATVEKAWSGFGMRGNASSPVRFDKHPHTA